MTERTDAADRLSAAMTSLGLGSTRMAALLAVSRQSVASWRSGKRTVPETIVRFVELLALHAGCPIAHVRLDPALFAWLKAEAEARRVSQAQVVRDALYDAMAARMPDESDAADYVPVCAQCGGDPT